MASADFTGTLTKIPNSEEQCVPQSLKTTTNFELYHATSGGAPSAREIILVKVPKSFTSLAWGVPHIQTGHQHGCGCPGVGKLLIFYLLGRLILIIFRDQFDGAVDIYWKPMTKRNKIVIQESVGQWLCNQLDKQAKLGPILAMWRPGWTLVCRPDQQTNYLGPKVRGS